MSFVGPARDDSVSVAMSGDSSQAKGVGVRSSMIGYGSVDTTDDNVSQRASCDRMKFTSGSWHTAKTKDRAVTIKP